MKNEHFMERCLRLALQAYGQTSPNPLVGAVVVKNGKIIAEGFHKKAGAPHAEVVALRKAGQKARGADLYVNLEPCCHFGRTPPCTDVIIKAGIKRLIYGMRDPNPKVKGYGLKILKDAGIEIIGPLLEDECKKLNRPFIKWVTTGMPYVTAKIAMTFDGKIADSNGNSKWVSNEASRRYAHWLRAGSDAVMVGVGTFKKDRPQLNVRLPGYKGKQPVPIVVKNPPSPPFKKGGDLAVTPFEKGGKGVKSPFEKGGKGVKSPFSKGGFRGINYKKFLFELGSAGFQSILVEGGSALHSKLFKKGLVDAIVIFIAPKLLGSGAMPWLNDIGRRTIKKPLEIYLENSFLLNSDIVLEGIIKR